ncbi:MAG TPA: hypothetical protein VNN08_22980 [Thermoanaerobaculia bacterium]|nr:hypothetical protein [Thermoanaerobaculia bacterium]
MRHASAAIVIVLLAGLSSASAASEIQISDTTLNPTPPYRLRTTAVSNGNGYLIAWEESLVADPDSTTIYIRAVGADGVPTGTMATALGTGLEPRIAWNGHEYLVVWGVTSPTGGPLPTPAVVGVRVREDGSPIDLQPVTLVSEVNPFSLGTTVVWSGSQYLVTWDRGMALVDTDLHAKLVLLPSTGGNPTYSATSDGSFVVLTIAYSSVSGSFKAMLYIVPISSTGEVGTPILLNGSRANAVGIDGGYALIWDDNVNLHFARLQTDGKMLSTSIVGPGSVGFPRLATRDGRIVASWESMPDGNHTRVCTARLDTLSQPTCSVVTAGIQHDPAIAIASTSVLAVWSERENGVDSVRMAVTPSSDVPRADLGSGRSLSDIQPPALVAEGHGDGTVAAAWSEYNKGTEHLEVHLGGTTSKATKLPERVVFATALDQTSPVIAAGAGRTMVLWTEGQKIRMTVVDDASKAVIATLPLATGTAPSVAFDGDEWLVAWQSSLAGGVVQFAVVNSDGNMVSSGALGIAAPTSLSQSAPAVAWSGKTFLVTWRESAAPGQPPVDRIQVSTVNAAGVSSLPMTLDFSTASLSNPSIAGNADRILVAWGRPVNTLRQALFDSGGKQLGNFIDFAWPYAFTRTRTHAMAGGFASLAGSRMALTSSDGRALATMNVPPVAATGDFAVDPANRFAFVYSHAVAGAGIATFAEILGLPRRRPQNH